MIDHGSPVSAPSLARGGRVRRLSRLVPALLLFSPLAAISAAERLGIPGMPNDGRGCSSFCLRNDGYAVFGANMDWNVGDRGFIYVNKRGVLKESLYTSSVGTRLQWTSSYASVTFNLVSYEYPWGGMNEKGLAFSTMSLNPAYIPPVGVLPPLDGPQWMQYVLDTCDTVDDVIAALSQVTLYVAEHFLISDRFGNCAVVEAVDGRLLVHSSKDLPIAALANTDYGTSLDYWYRYRGSGSYDQLNQSARRFCKAADRVRTFRSVGIDAAVDYAFETLDTIAGEVNGGHISQWRVVFDARNLRVHFRTHQYPVVRSIDLCRFDLSCDGTVKMLSIPDELSGDVTGRFGNISFDASLEQFIWFCRNWGITVSDEEARRRMTVFTGYPCVDTDTSSRFVVSREAGGVNIDPRVAVNPSTGDALVVWTRQGERSAPAAVRSAMLIRSMTGGYSAVEEHLLNDGAGHGARPFPVFLPKSGQFCVVWDEADPSKPAAESRIMGRLLAANGLPEKGLITVLSNGRRNESPQLYTLPAAGSCVLFGSAKAASEEQGLCVARLNGAFKAGKPNLLMADDRARVLPSGFGEVVGEDLIVPVVLRPRTSTGEERDQPMVLAIDDFRRVADSEIVGGEGAIRPSLCVHEDAPGTAMLVGSVLQDGAVLNKAMRLSAPPGQPPSLTPLFQTTGPKEVIDSQVVGLATGGAQRDSSYSAAGTETIAFVVSATSDGDVIRRRIDTRGKASGPYKKLFEHDLTLKSLFARDVFPGDRDGRSAAGAKAELLTVWQCEISGRVHPIRADVVRTAR